MRNGTKVLNYFIDIDVYFEDKIKMIFLHEAKTESNEKMNDPIIPENSNSVA